MIVNCDFLGRFVVHFHNDLVILIDFKNRTWGLAVDKEHLAGEAIWGVVLPCYLQVEFLGVCSRNRCYESLDNKR